MFALAASLLFGPPSPWVAVDVAPVGSPGVVSIAKGWELKAPRSDRWVPLDLPARRLWRHLVTGGRRCWRRRNLPVAQLRRDVAIPAKLAGRVGLHLGAFAGSLTVFVNGVELVLDPLTWYVVVPPHRLIAGVNRVRIEIEFACWQGGLQTRGEPRWGPMQPRYRGGFLSRFRSRQDDTVQPYSVYVPKRWRTDRPVPMVVGLHGFGGDPTSFIYMTLLDELDRRGWIGLFPYGRGKSLYVRKGEVDILEAIAEVERRISVDKRRVYITGFSMGGTGTLTTALRRPHRFAAAAAYQTDAKFDVAFDRFHRPYFLRKKWFRGDLAAAKRYSPEELLYNAAYVPLMVVQGTADTISPVKHAHRLRAMARRVRGGGRKGRRLRTILIPGLDHEQEVIHRTIREAFALFDRSVSPEAPPRVAFRCDDPSANRAYWLTLHPRPNRWAHADVSVDRARRRVVIHDARAPSLSIDWVAAGLDTARPVTVCNRSRRTARIGAVRVRAKRCASVRP